MIPKIIHYCWFGRKPLPPLAVKCIESWKKYLPDYTIKEWNEDNFDVDDSNSITLVAVQDSVDERINYYHDTPNQTKIGMATIRTMNILYYYAQRMPSKEVDFRKTSGSGKTPTARTPRCNTPGNRSR